MTGPIPKVEKLFPSLPSAVARSPRSFGNAWMITFTDLVALMLTFFVLLFSMSQVEIQMWQNMVRSLDNKFDTIQERQGARPAIEYQVDVESISPGKSLDYLAPIVRQQITADPTLTGSVVRRLPGRVVLSFPGSLLFSPGSETPTPGAHGIVYAIGVMLQNLQNVIEVEAHEAPATAGPAVWERTLARAVAVTAMLTESGYQGPVVARGFGASRRSDFLSRLSEARRPEFADRIDIVIRERAREGS